MENEKILKMIESGETEELKVLLREEIYLDAMSAKAPGARTRAAAMKKYISYIPEDRREFSQELNNAEVMYEGEKYYLFCNAYSAILTKETNLSLPHPEDSKENRRKQEKILELFKWCGEEKCTIDMKELFAKAKMEGYKLTKKGLNEPNSNPCFFQLSLFNGDYSLALIDASFRIIDDGSEVKVFARSGFRNSNNSIQHLVLQNDTGKVFILPSFSKGIITNVRNIDGSKYLIPKVKTIKRIKRKKV